MGTVAIYSAKGGVGKTSLAVNLAWAAAALSSRRTLLWDLDAQAAASFILAPGRRAGDEARAVIRRDLPPERLVVPTAIPNLHLLPADASLRGPDLLFAEAGAKRLRRIADSLAQGYDRVVVDCPPGLGPTADQVLRSARVVVVPAVPSALSLRAEEEVRERLAQRAKAAAHLLPVFNLVDRRRAGHREVLAAAPGRPAVPMASAVEQMAFRHLPVAAFAPRSPAVPAVRDIWVRIERLLASPTPIVD